MAGRPPACLSPGPPLAGRVGAKTTYPPFASPLALAPLLPRSPAPVLPGAALFLTGAHGGAAAGDTSQPRLELLAWPVSSLLLAPGVGGLPVWAHLPACLPASAACLRAPRGIVRSKQARPSGTLLCGRAGRQASRHPRCRAATRAAAAAPTAHGTLVRTLWLSLLSLGLSIHPCQSSGCWLHRRWTTALPRTPHTLRCTAGSEARGDGFARLASDSWPPPSCLSTSPSPPLGPPLVPSSPVTFPATFTFTFTVTIDPPPPFPYHPPPDLPLRCRTDCPQRSPSFSLPRHIGPSYCAPRPQANGTTSGSPSVDLVDLGPSQRLTADAAL
ncbi:uncharacterized protein PSFLO_03480 [Pseudozyma flocculosa]|uniref:Uncharacterized protein n=1 Tax=Pseudozyma flocculosa TaxID=84751 RepID=A0A5C3F0G4_9BASI|nr:uncharacterized protein PSFLO_03480 [Pseudozyma flocculosa]